MGMQDTYTLQTSLQLKQLLVSFRKQAKLTQAALAEQLGISQQSYAQIEANPMVTNVERLHTILRLLGVELQLKIKAESAARIHLFAPPSADAPKKTRQHKTTLLTEPVDESHQAVVRKNTSPQKLSPKNSSKKDRW